VEKSHRNIHENVKLVDGMGVRHVLDWQNNAYPIL
jgi:hypothetical protein